MVRIDLPTCSLRPWKADDAASLARHADDREIWLHLRDFFPHPYTLADAEGYLSRVTVAEGPPVAMAIEVGGHACGGISATLGYDVHRLTAEIGYWIGRECRGLGIMTEVVGAFTEHLFTAFRLERVFAVPYVNNPASGRTLENNGFLLEGTMRRSAVKDGKVLDQWLWAKVRGSRTDEQGSPGSDP